MARLKDLYQGSVRERLMKEFGYRNVNEVPRLEKIIINCGLGEAIDNPKLLEVAMNELALITGQRPCVARAKKSISNFKLRAGTAIGCKVTLRGERMYEFFDRLVNVAIPRVRDFRGVPTRSFDGRGNFSLGVKEQIIFPEIDYDKVEKIHGLDITIVTSAERDDEALALLRELGMPFRRPATEPGAEEEEPSGVPEGVEEASASRA